MALYLMPHPTTARPSPSIPVHTPPPPPHPPYFRLHRYPASEASQGGAAAAEAVYRLSSAGGSSVAPIGSGGGGGGHLFENQLYLLRASSSMNLGVGGSSGRPSATGALSSSAAALHEQQQQQQLEEELPQRVSARALGWPAAGGMVEEERTDVGASGRAALDSPPSPGPLGRGMPASIGGGAMDSPPSPPGGGMRASVDVLTPPGFVPMSPGGPDTGRRAGGDDSPAGGSAATSLAPHTGASFSSPMAPADARRAFSGFQIHQPPSPYSLRATEEDAAGEAEAAGDEAASAAAPPAGLTTTTTTHSSLRDGGGGAVEPAAELGKEAVGAVVLLERVIRLAGQLFERGRWRELGQVLSSTQPLALPGTGPPAQQNGGGGLEWGTGVEVAAAGHALHGMRGRVRYYGPAHWTKGRPANSCPWRCKPQCGVGRAGEGRGGEGNTASRIMRPPGRCRRPRCASAWRRAALCAASPPPSGAG